MANENRELGFSTDRGIRFLEINSPLGKDGRPLQNVDTVGVLYNPANKTKAKFKLQSNGKQYIETKGWLPWSPIYKLQPGTSAFQQNLDMIRGLSQRYQLPAKKSAGGHLDYTKIFK